MDLAKFGKQKTEILTIAQTETRGAQIMLSVVDSLGQGKTVILKADDADALGRDLITRAALARSER